MNHAAGTWVKFTSDSRLRKISDKGVPDQKAMGEGVLIGENKEAVLVQPLGTDAYTVFFPDLDLFGWVYTYEFVVLRTKEPMKLTLKPVK